MTTILEDLPDLKNDFRKTLTELTSLLESQTDLPAWSLSLIEKYEAQMVRWEEFLGDYSK